MSKEIDPTAAVVVERARRAPRPRLHRLEQNPPPPMRACTIDQIESDHPGTKDRIRQWIHRADSGDPAFAWLRLCVIRLGRSVLIDEVRFRDSLYQRTAIPAARPRNTGTKAAA